MNNLNITIDIEHSLLWLDERISEYIYEELVDQIGRRFKTTGVMRSALHDIGILEQMEEKLKAVLEKGEKG